MYVSQRDVVSNALLRYTLSRQVRCFALRDALLLIPSSLALLLLLLLLRQQP